MNYCIDPSANEPIMLIDRHIGFDDDEGQGIDGSLFAQELLYLDSLGKSKIHIWINSAGGVVMDGYSIYNAILKTKTKVDTCVHGIAASIAAVIFQAGRYRTMSDYSLLMYHNPYGGDGGEELAKMKESLATMIAERTGKTVDEVHKIMDRTTWMTASEALDAGFCDMIEVSSNQNKKRATNDAKALWKQGATVLNSILKNNNYNKMIKVANKLELNESASEDAIISAITDIQNKKAESDKKAEEIKKKMDEMDEDHKSKMEDLKKQLDECKNELEDSKNKAKEAEDKAEDDKIKNMLDGFVAQGRIKVEAKDSWQSTAKAVGVDKVKDMIANLPISKSAVTIDVQNGATGEAVLSNVIASTMRDTRNKYGL